VDADLFSAPADVGARIPGEPAARNGQDLSTDLGDNSHHLADTGICRLVDNRVAPNAGLPNCDPTELDRLPTRKSE
jgi:hypothetical protein